MSRPLVKLVQGLGVAAAVVSILLGMFFMVSAGVGFLSALEGGAPNVTLRKAGLISSISFAIGLGAFCMGFRILRRPRVAADEVSPSTPPQLRVHAMRSVIAGAIGIAGGLLLDGGVRWFLLACGVVSIVIGVLMFRASRRRGF